MATFTISDVTGSANIILGDDSLLAHWNLKKIASGTARFVAELQQSIKDVDFRSATFGAVFQSPEIDLDGTKSLSVSAGANCTLTRYAEQDGALLGTDPTVPEIDIKSGDYWLSFTLKTTLEVGGNQSSASGLGVSVSVGSVVNLTSYTRFSASAGPLPTLGSAIGAALTGFAPLATARAIRNQKPGTVQASDVSGTVTVSGSYSLPISVNQLALAEAMIPFQFTVNPSLDVSVGGSVALTGDYSVVSWRKSESEVVLALMKQRGTTITATFSAGAGLTATAGNIDLIEAFLNAVSPGIDLSKSGLSKSDDRYGAMSAVLTDSISRALSVSVNASCAATFSKQAAFIYSIDLSRDTNNVKAAATDAALNAAMRGDWSLLATLPNAKELRNVLESRRETKLTLTVNLLGLFNYESIEDFLRSSTIVHDALTGSVTITDGATAKRITTASEPYLADSDKLRLVLYESTVATAAYTLVSGGLTAEFILNQSLLIYKARMSAAELRKNLRLAVAIGELTSAQLDGLQMVNPSHVLIDASQTLGHDQLFKLFFSDAGSRTPHPIDHLTRLGRRTLADLLDASNPADARRIRVLNDDGIWKNMDDNHGTAPSDSPASYSDWYDVTFWANAICNTGKPLKAILDALQNMPAGVDPTTVPDFMRQRNALKKVIGEVTKQTHAAFEMGWPIAVTYAVVGGNTRAMLKALWNGQTHVPLAQAKLKAG